MADDKGIFSVKEFGVLVEQGKASYKSGRLLDAIQAWRKAQAADPSRRGELTGYLDKAIQKQSALHLANAGKFEAAGDRDKAADQYKMILRLEPKDEALRTQASERLQAFDPRANVMSAALLASIAGAFALVVLLAILLILRMD